MTSENGDDDGGGDDERKSREAHPSQRSTIPGYLDRRLVGAWRTSTSKEDE